MSAILRHRIILGHAFLIIFLFSSVGCGAEKARKVDMTEPEEAEEAAADLPQIRIGLVPEQDIRKMAERYEPLAAYLTKRIGTKVTLVYLDSYGEVADKFIYRQLDGAFFGSFSYALTRAKAGIEPIARPEYGDVSTYRGLVIVRRDSGIKNSRDMKDRRLALVHHATYAGYLYPLYYFRMKGIDDFNSYFSKVIFTGSHDKAISAVLRGDVDVAIAKDLVYQRMAKESPGMERELDILAGSEPVPSNALCAAKDMDPALKAKLKKILTGMADDSSAGPVLRSLGGAAGFIETKDEDYRSLYVVIKALGIDLKTYPYYERPDMGFGEEI